MIPLGPGGYLTAEYICQHHELETHTDRSGPGVKEQELQWQWQLQLQLPLKAFCILIRLSAARQQPHFGFAKCLFTFALAPT